jgi:hypothetical protein
MSRPGPRSGKDLLREMKAATEQARAAGAARLPQAEAALNCYRRALDTVEGTDIPALGVFAWRALLLAQEMQG